MAENPKISINYKWCKACGICIDMCPTGVYQRDELGKPKDVFAEKCTSCRLCELRCPDFAIRIGGKK